MMQTHGAGMNHHASGVPKAAAVAIFKQAFQVSRRTVPAFCFPGAEQFMTGIEQALVHIIVLVSLELGIVTAQIN